MYKTKTRPVLMLALLGALAGLVPAPGGRTARAQDTGVTATTLRVGSVMALSGPASGLGLRMKAGLQKALEGQKVKGRQVELIILDDAYNPAKTREEVQKLIDQGVFVMLGNVGTPTTQAALPLLAEHKIPAIGFLTGSSILRPGIGDVVNFRTSYGRETAQVVEIALNQGIKPTEICAYVQNDAYGMAGLAGIRQALTERANVPQIVQLLDKIINLEGQPPARNNLGPVGVYQVETSAARDGYKSLKNWESTSGNRCRLVISVGVYEPIAQFIGYARYKGENWIISAVSATSAEDFREALVQYKVNDHVIMTQVVPSLDSNLPIVQEARQALGEQLSFISLEGFIVGKMFLKIAASIEGELTRANFLKAVRGRSFDLSGLPLDFSNDNQGSDLVALTYVDSTGYRAMRPEDWR